MSKIKIKTAKEILNKRDYHIADSLYLLRPSQYHLNDAKSDRSNNYTGNQWRDKGIKRPISGANNVVIKPAA